MSLKAVSLSEQIAEHLSERIVRGDLAPGEKLPEAELAKELDVSTNSLREAFRLLEKRHLIRLQPRRGARVCEVTESEVRDLYNFLFLLLSHLAAQAARDWKPGEIEDLAIDLFEVNNVAEAFGGGPLLGVKGVIVLGHGRARADSVRRAIGTAAQTVEAGFIPRLSDELDKIRKRVGE